MYVCIHILCVYIYCVYKGMHVNVIVTELNGFVYATNSIVKSMAWQESQDEH